MVYSEVNDADSVSERYIEQQLCRPESRRLEFKEASRQFSYEKLQKYCCAFANVGGGAIFLGVTDQLPRQVVGTEAFSDYIDKEHRLRELLGLPIKVTEYFYKGKRLLEFKIPSRPRGQAICLNDGVFWTRSGESLVPMTSSDLEEIFRETKVPFEEEKVREHCTTEEIFSLLDTDAVCSRLRDYPEQRQDDCLCDLEQLRFIRKASHAPEYWDITNLGALIAAKNLEDFNLGNFKIRVLKYQSTNKIHTVSDEFFVEGYAISMPKTIAHLKRMLPIREEIGEDRATIEIYPEVALRELVGNALIHQDFDSPSGGNYPTIEIFEDRVEISNGGQPLIEVRKFLRENSQRNRDLSDAMRRLKFAENRGSGVDRTLQALEQIHGAAPEFIKESQSTKVILHGNKKWEQLSGEERKWSAYLHCALLYENGGGMTNTSLRNRFNLPASKSSQVTKVINDLLESNQIMRDPRAPGGRRGSRYIPVF